MALQMMRSDVTPSRELKDYFARSEVSLSCGSCGTKHRMNAPDDSYLDMTIHCHNCGLSLGTKGDLRNKAFDEVGRQFDSRKGRREVSSWLQKA